MLRLGDQEVTSTRATDRGDAGGADELHNVNAVGRSRSELCHEGVGAVRPSNSVAGYANGGIGRGQDRSAPSSVRPPRSISYPVSHPASRDA